MLFALLLIHIPHCLLKVYPVQVLPVFLCFLPLSLPDTTTVYGFQSLPGIAGLCFKLERNEMKSTLLDLRCRSMKSNLVFTGLRETAGEETEAKLRVFCLFHYRIQRPSTVFNLCRELLVYFVWLPP
jgi:hypothetical protein